MKRIIVLSSIIALVLVLAVAVIAWADDTLSGYGPGYGDCPIGEFVDEDGDGICDNALPEGSCGFFGRRGMMQQGRSFFDRFGDGPMNGQGRMGRHSSAHHGEGRHFIDADGDGICDNFVDEDGDGVCDTSPCDGTGTQARDRGFRRIPQQLENSQ